MRESVLNFPNLSPGDVIADELSFQLTEIVQTPRTIDQISIRNAVCRARKEIGQADLIPHISRDDGQRRVKETRDLLEEITEEFVLAGVSTRGIPLFHFQRAFHALVAVTGKER